MKYVFEISTDPVNKDFPIEMRKKLSNGAVTPPRYMRVEDLAELLSQPVESVNFDAVVNEPGVKLDNEVGTPLLPLNTVSFSSAEGKAIYERILVTVPKGIYPISYRDTDNTYLVGFPKLLMQFTLIGERTDKHDTGKRRIIGTKVYALKDERLVKESTPLYVFPFPNVNKSDGMVCWGGNSSDLLINKLSELDLIATKFVTSAFNEDYNILMDFTSSKENEAVKPVKSFEEYIEAYEDTTFNDDLLIPTPNLNVASLMCSTRINKAGI